MTVDELKEAVAEHAVAAHVRSGMRLGLGTGSTAVHVVAAVGRRVRSGELTGLVCVPTSEATGRLAAAFGIALTTLTETPRLDLAIDGTDEVAPDLSLTKGLGGAALREKVVARAAEAFVVVADESKRVPRLGTRARIPVEVVPFAAGAVRGWLEDELGLEVELRQAPAPAPAVGNAQGAPGATYVTDGGNWIYDCSTAPLDDPRELADRLDGLPGVLGHGLFLGLAQVVYLAGPNGIDALRRA